MTPLQIVFIIAAAATVGCAIMVVTSRNLVHAALYLIAALFGISVVYVLLNASFLAMVQIVVYIGAISILMLFAIMLTRRVMKDSGPQQNRNWPLAALFSTLTLGGILWILASWPGFQTELPDLDPATDTLRELGAALVSTQGYVIPFEVASVLLVAAMIGAIYVAWERE